jgi:hypothetical protein
MDHWYFMVYTWIKKSFNFYKIILVFGFIDNSNKHLKCILCIGPLHNTCYLPFQNNCLSKFQFSKNVWSTTIKKSHLWHEIDQTFQMIHKHGSNYVKSYKK